MYPSQSQAQLEKVDESMLEIESIAAGVSELKVGGEVSVLMPTY